MPNGMKSQPINIIWITSHGIGNIATRRDLNKNVKNLSRKNCDILKS
jgi:hypothetical protein